MLQELLEKISFFSMIMQLFILKLQKTFLTVEIYQFQISQSLKINIIENVWEKLSKIIYEGGKQYNNFQKLKETILCT